MDAVLQIVESGDTGSLLVLIGLLAAVGRRMIDNRSDLARWGLRCAAAAFVAYGVYGVSQTGYADADVLIGVAFRGLLAAGLTLGVAWIALAVYGFLSVVAARGAEARLYAEQRRQRQRQEGEEQARRKQEQAAWECDRPRREAAAQDADNRRYAEERERTEAQRRREAARLACELFYDLHAADLAARLPRARLEAHLANYFTDTLPPELVEERAGQLKDMLANLTEQNGAGKPRFKSLNEVVEFYREEQEVISGLDMPDDIKDSLRADLALEESRAIREMRQR